MTGFVRYIKSHALALVIALVVGLFSVAPHLLASRQIGAEYQGFPFIYLDDEEIYMGRMQEILDGHWPVGSPFFHEYKDTPTLMLPLAESLYAYASQWLRVPLASVIVATKFLFPALLFWLAYELSRRLLADGEEPSGVKLTAIAGGVLVTLGYDLAYDALSAWRVSQGADHRVWLSLWTRPVNPITGALLLFGYLILLWETIKCRQIWLTIPTGMLLCLMVSYVFSWGMAVSVSFMLGLFYLAQKNWTAAKRLGITVGIGAILSVAYVLYQSPDVKNGDASVLLKNGLFFTRTPMLNKTLLVATAIFVLLLAYRYFKTKNWKAVVTRDWWLFSAAFLLGGLWAFSQQLLTGRTIWPYHFVQYTKPLSSLALLVAGFHLLKPSWPRAWRMVMFGAIGASLIVNAILVSTYRFKLEDFRNRQPLMHAFEWLNRQAPKDCVVLAKEEIEDLSRFIPAFTRCDVYLSTSVFSGVPIERIQHNFFVNLRFKGIKTATLERYLSEHRDQVRETFFSSWTELFHLGDESWIDDKIKELVPQYEAFLKEDFSLQLRKYQFDFLVSREELTAEQRRVYGLQNGEFVGSLWIYRPL